jgi:hypothetical protein
VIWMSCEKAISLKVLDEITISASFVLRSMHGGENRPSWLNMNLLVRTLESLQLNDAPWTNFPSLGSVAS